MEESDRATLEGKGTEADNDGKDKSDGRQCGEASRDAARVARIVYSS